MTTSTISAEADAYLAAVRAELDDLPEEERGELLDDLSSHLAEVSTHDTDDGTPLQLRLGSPAQYAAELRAAAGLPPRAAPSSTDEPSRRRIAEVLASSGAGRLATRLRHHPWMVGVLRLLRDLRPAWWVLRGYLVVAVPVMWAPNGYRDFPLPTVLGSGTIGGASVVAAVVASVALGRRAVRPRTWPLLRALDVVLALAALVLVVEASSRSAPVHHLDAPFETGSALQSRYGPVTNIYPYAADGIPLEDVQLFDQEGRPLRVEPQQWWTDGCERVPRYPVAADGVPVPWVYPQEYVVRGPATQGICQVVRRPTVPLPTFGDEASGRRPPGSPADSPDVEE
jgi:hypothetical protein